MTSEMRQLRSLERQNARNQRFYSMVAHYPPAPVERRASILDNQSSNMSATTSRKLFVLSPKQMGLTITSKRGFGLKSEADTFTLNKSSTRKMPVVPTI